MMIKMISFFSQLLHASDSQCFLLSQCEETNLQTHIIGKSVKICAAMPTGECLMSRPYVTVTVNCMSRLYVAFDDVLMTSCCFPNKKSFELQCSTLDLNTVGQDVRHSSMTHPFPHAYAYPVIEKKSSQTCNFSEGPSEQGLKLHVGHAIMENAILRHAISNLDMNFAKTGSGGHATFFKINVEHEDMENEILKHVVSGH